MEKGFNLQILDFKNAVIQAVNNANLPISVVTMVMNDITNDLRIHEQTTLQSELKAFNEAQATPEESEVIE